MTCSWEYNFLINNDYIFFVGKDCVGNYPRAVKMKLGDSVILNTTFHRSIRIDNPCRGCIESFSEVAATKIGLIWIDKKECKDILEYFDILDDKSRWNKIIWSNSLYLRPKQIKAKVYLP
jgi:hypothetical protein